MKEPFTNDLVGKGSLLLHVWGYFISFLMIVPAALAAIRPPIRFPPPLRIASAVFQMRSAL